MSSRSARAQAVLERWCGLNAGAALVSARFRSELDAYTEMSVGEGRNAIGVMTRGEGAGFTERAQQTLSSWGMPPSVCAHHRRLATWFEHKRAFLKLGWHAHEDRHHRRVSCYFRRRPPVAVVVQALAEWGCAPVVCERVSWLGALLEKSSVHFVSAALRSDQPILHKIYFSQFATDKSRGVIAERLATALAAYGLDDAAWQRAHDHSVPSGESSLFVSMSFTADRVVPSLKIDYPGIKDDRAPLWLSEPARAACAAEIAAARRDCGARRMSWLGVRFRPRTPDPILKYYLELPTAPRTSW